MTGFDYLLLSIAVTLYLFLAAAHHGPGGDQEAFEKGKRNIAEFVEVIKGNDKPQ